MVNRPVPLDPSLNKRIILRTSPFTKHTPRSRRGHKPLGLELNKQKDFRNLYFFPGDVTGLSNVTFILSVGIGGLSLVALLKLWS